MTEVLTYSGDETVAFGRNVGGTLSRGAIVLLSGPLGAGKTTFTKGIAEALGIREAVTSPTFTILSEYEGAIPLHHIDLYRIGSIEELELLGLDEIVYGDGVTIVEWAERAPGYFVDPICVSIAIRSPEERLIRVLQPGETPSSVDVDVRSKNA